MLSTWGRSEQMVPVWHYDGSSAVRHQAELLPAPGGFRLVYDESNCDFYSWSDLQFGEVRGADSIYLLKGRRGWRIGVEGPPPAEIASFLPKGARYGRWIDRIGLWPATSAFVALSAVVVFIVVKTPDVLAPMIPMAWEQKLGDAMIGDFGGRLCHGPGSDAAIAALSKRLDPKGEPLDIQIANINMVNAVALPGGNIIIFRGLLQEAKSPDELAGVLGHEIGHVRNRDVMQSMLRQLGLSAVLGGAGSDATGYLNNIVSMTYSRDAEAKADLYSINLMQTSRVSPMDTAGFFARLAEVEKGVGKEAKAALGYLSSHPLSDTREKAFKASVVQGATYTPVISATEWRAIIDSCAKDPKVKRDDGLFF
jgi:beta-barrel assembly-enhancing protease